MLSAAQQDGDDGDRDKSTNPSRAHQRHFGSEDWKCPSCNDTMHPAQQVSCACGYTVCQPCWQIAANFGGHCPTCGCPADVESIRQRAVRERHTRLSSNREDRSTSSSVGSTISRSNTPSQDLHHAPGPKQSTPGQRQQQQHQMHKRADSREIEQLPSPRQQRTEPGIFIRGADRRVLQNLRVIQRTLVYAIGLSPNFAQAGMLKQPEYFGQYGEIAKLVINHHQGVSPDDPRYGSASAYITFRRQEDAWAAICSVDGFRLMGRTIRASFGTTKYCNSFLRNLPCNNPECLYLHELGDEGDRFTKDEVQLGLARHGSSFAFREDVLGTRNGANAGSRGRTHKPQPTNPVLPPPCPATHSPRQGELAGAPQMGQRPVADSPQSLPSERRTHDDRGPAAAAVVPGLRSSSMVPDADGRLAGAQPESPLATSADDRPRPRRRRGQRGRRGGGGGVGPGMASGNSSASAGALAGNSDNGARFGQVAGLVPVPSMYCAGGSSGIGRASSVPGPSALLPVSSDFHGGTRYGQGPTGTSVDSAMGLRSHTMDPGAASGMRTCAPASEFLSSQSRFAGAETKADRFNPDGLGYGGTGLSSGDLHQPAPKPAAQHGWGGSDRGSASSCRSVCGGNSFGGRTYWNSRGSPLATPDTLTNTPPVEISPSGAGSPPPVFTGIARAPHGLWHSRGLAERGGGPNWREENDGDEGASSLASGMLAHRHHLQLRPPPAFFGLGDGVQISTGRQQMQPLHDGSRGGDLESISESRHGSDDKIRSRSEDSLAGEQQEPRTLNPSAPGAIASKLAQDCCVSQTGGGNDGYSSPDAVASLFIQRASHSSAAADPQRREAVESTISSLLPGLDFVREGRSERLGSGHSDDLPSCADRLARLSWDDQETPGDPAIGTLLSSLPFTADEDEDSSGSRAESGDTVWMPPAFSPAEPFAVVTSQAEAFGWRHSTPQLFA